MRQTLAVLALGTILAAGTAAAQTDDAQSDATAPANELALTEVADRTIVAPFDMDADRLDDLDVYTAEGTRIGEVEEVLGSDRETATHLALDVEDDSVFGDRDVVAPLEAFTLEGDRLILSLGVEEMAALPTWTDD